ncbi:hypothetical protein CDAR_549521 [Caerostris darwini]|uniref:Uncharacterized protein n=1 Tax=Caerostris darwini TaxID=1538125 RepID=A0AAV4V8J7_9ARAC|nr:hypothetical protein CDAR_549521 [Caerostris darwini]
MTALIQNLTSKPKPKFPEPYARSFAKTEPCTRDNAKLITTYGHCSAIGPEISLRILAGVVKPAGGEMSEHHRLDEGMRWRIVGRLEAGRSQAQVARELDITPSVISNLWS